MSSSVSAPRWRTCGERALELLGEGVEHPASTLEAADRPPDGRRQEIPRVPATLIVLPRSCIYDGRPLAAVPLSGRHRAVLVAAIVALRAADPAHPSLPRQTIRCPSRSGTSPTSPGASAARGARRSPAGARGWRDPSGVRVPHGVGRIFDGPRPRCSSTRWPRAASSPPRRLRHVVRDRARGARRQVGVRLRRGQRRQRGERAVRPSGGGLREGRSWSTGFSQGGYLAVRAHNHDARVRGAYAIGFSDGAMPADHMAIVAPWPAAHAVAARRPAADRQRLALRRHGRGHRRAHPARRAHGTTVRRRGEPVPGAGRLRRVPRAALRGGRRDRRPLLLPRRRRLFVQPAVSTPDG